MSGDLEDMRTYARGYQDGMRSKDADHAAVALRLSRLTFDGGSHENLHKIAYAIYPCATGWTCESSKGLRDRLIDLLGGVHEHHCDSGRGCACGNRDSGNSGEHAEAMTYDVLGNERHKAVCELREFVPMIGHKPTEEASKLIRCITGNDDSHVACGNDLEETRDRLIHLLGGDQPTFRDKWNIRKDSESASADGQSRSGRLKGKTCDFVILDELGGKSEGAQVVAEPNSQESPILANSGVDDDGEVTITAEFREAIETATKTYEGSWYEMDDADHTICHITEGELLGIADRMERRFSKALISRGTKLGCYKLRINQLEAECDQLRANLEEADAAIANWRERENSFDESEHERDELRRSLRQIAEQAGVPHDRDLSEYSDEKIANAVIGQLGQTNQYVKSLEWVRDKRLPRIEAERDDLRARLDEYDQTHVELPKDADGRVLHRGDVIKVTEKDGRTLRGEVSFVVLSDDCKSLEVCCDVDDCVGYRDSQTLRLCDDTPEFIVCDMRLGNITDGEAIGRIERLPNG